MITRVEITLGLLSMLGVIAITALVGIGEFGENGRMAKAERGFDMRSVESGAQMFDQYCATCHGFNASGLNCPPLDETSGLHGGDLGEGIAWRLEELNWPKGDAYGYVYSSIAAGKTVSSRPDRYPPQDEVTMAMPAWGQDYGGPLRGDQIADIANYVVHFRAYFPEASEPDALDTACELALENIASSNPNYVSSCYERLGRKPPTPEPTAAPTAEATETAEADEDAADEDAADDEAASDEDADEDAAATDEDAADEEDEG